MKQILTCTDGSVCAQSVYDHSAWAAKRTGAQVHVLHMIDHHREKAAIADASGTIGPNANANLLEELVRFEEAKVRIARMRGKALLEEASRQLMADGVKVETEQRHGSLVEAVESMERAIDMVVIGKRGESADFAKMHLGSNLERVIRASNRPVLVAARAFKEIGSFLIAYDGGPSARKAVEYAIAQPLLRGLKCHLIRVSKPDSAAERGLAHTKGELEDAGFVVEADLIGGEPEAVIAEVVNAKGIDLLVMGAYGHSKVRQLILGSTTSAMVRTCLVPVLLFR